MSLNQHHAPRLRLTELSRAWLCAALLASALCLEAFQDGEVIEGLAAGVALACALAMAVRARSVR